MQNALAGAEYRPSQNVTDAANDLKQWQQNRPGQYQSAYQDKMDELMDALLGCAALGDIGRLFPDADARFDNISSAVLLDDVLERFRDAGLTLCHVDLTVVAQTPKLAPHREEIRKNVARLLGLGTDSVNIKATTEEKLGFTGACEGIKAYAVATAFQLPPHPRNTKEMA